MRESEGSSVAIVIPSLGDTALLERCLPPLLEELERRGEQGDEIVVVDDTGEGLLSDALAESCPTVRVMALAANVGFARALLAGAQSSDADLLFVMNPDVVARPGFLDPLVETLADPEVAVVSPRVLLDGQDTRCESHSALCVEDGHLRVIERPVAADPVTTETPIAFAVGGAMLMRREEFLARGGFDALYAPFYFEDVDLGVDVWRSGRRVVEDARSVVEHHHRGTVGKTVPERLITAAIEKNRFLLHWKFLDNRRAAHDHLAALWRDALDAGVSGRREELLWLALALEELPNVNAARKALAKRTRPFEEVLRVADPLSG